MNIVLINHYAGSPDMGMEFRPYYMAQEWVKAGHTVHIYAADYSHLRKKNPVVMQDFMEEIKDGIHYHWIKTRKYTENGLKRATTMVQFVMKLRINAKRIVEETNPNVIITSSTYPLDTYAGQRIKKVSTNALLIHEIHDMWPITPIEIGGMSKYNPFIIIMQIAENSFCKQSDKIVSLLPNAKDYLIQHGMRKDKFHCIPNGIILDEWNTEEELPEEHKKTFRELEANGKFVIGFFGSHTKSYALTYLIDAVREIKDNHVCAVFVGDGMEKKKLIEYAKDLKNKVFFLPPVDKKCIPSLLKNMDCIYVGAVNNKMLRFGICMNKLFDAMMSGKLILYAVNAPNNYIEDYQCGVSVIPEDKEALICGINKIMEMSEERRAQLGINGQNAVLEHFEYSMLANEFLKIMK